MDNPEKLATLGTQDQRQRKQKHIFFPNLLSVKKALLV